MQHRHRQSNKARVGANTALIVIMLAFLGPMLWMVTASFNRVAQLGFEIPTSPSLDNFRRMGSWEQVVRPLLNSVVLSVTASIVTVVAATLCAYPLSRYKLRFKMPFLYLILMTSGLPILAIMIPTYRLFAELDLIDSRAAVAVFMGATSLPFAIWLAKNFIDGVPVSLEEAARVDGASTLQVITRVLLPLVRPGMIVLFIFAFIGNWGNFFVPFILFSSSDKQTASVSIYNYFNSLGGVYFGRVAAFAIIYSVPAVLLYAVISRTIGRSLSFAGAVKE